MAELNAEEMREILAQATDDELRLECARYGLSHMGDRERLVARLDREVIVNGRQPLPDQAPNPLLNPVPPPQGNADEHNMQQRERDLMQRELDVMRRERDLAQAELELYRARGAPIQQPPTFNANVREITGLLPEFDPSNRTSLNSDQFVRKVNALRAIYQWNDQLTLFAIAEKLKGPARQWFDSSDNGTATWAQLSQALSTRFPVMVNEAEIHDEMSNRKRRWNEDAIAFCYDMYAIGMRVNLSERAIVTYIIRGLNEPDLESALIASGVDTMISLTGRINNHMQYRKNRSNTRKWSDNNRSAPYQRREDREQMPLPNVPPMQAPLHRSAAFVAPRALGVKCYLCQQVGHVARYCPNRQRPQPTQSHPQQQSHRPPSVNALAGRKDNVTKTAILNDLEFSALIDSGSDVTLMSRSVAEASRLAIDEQDRIELTGFAQFTTKTIGSIITRIQIDKVDAEVKTYVVCDGILPTSLVIGTDYLLQPHVRTIVEKGKVKLEHATPGRIEVRFVDRKLEISAEDIQCELTCESRDKLLEIISDFHDCFSTGSMELGLCKIATATIELTSDVPVISKPYPVPYAERPRVNKEIDELLQAGIIVPSTSEYASPMLLVKKPDGSSRLCVDYRKLNSLTKKRPFPMPNVEAHLARLAGNRFYTIVDFNQGFYQIPLDERSQHFTAFVTNDGHYMFTRMPFGLTNGPAEFQALMAKVVAMLPTDDLLVFIDDVVLPSRTIEEGIEKLNRFLRVVREIGMTLKLTKCKFLSTEFDYLGHKLSYGQVTPGTKVNAIKEFPVPADVHQVRQFLGLTGYFRRFVANYSAIMSPVTDLLKKETEFIWNEQHQRAYEHVKSALCSAPTLVMYDVNAHHEVHTDASSIGLAAILLQAPNDQRTKLQPVQYFSRRTNEYEQKYHSYELELLAIVAACDRYKLYLLGKTFVVVTDCEAILANKVNRQLNARVARWWLLLQEFDFVLIHRAGDKMAHVDALSRNPVEPAKEMDVAHLNVHTLNITENDWLATMQRQDDKLMDLVSKLSDDRNKHQHKQLHVDYEIRNHRLFRKTADGLRLMVPNSIVWRIVQNAHDKMGHFGVDKTIERVKTSFWFPRMRQFIRNYIAACIECCYNKSRPSEGELHCPDVITIPFHKVHIDHLGPFKTSLKGNAYLIVLCDAFTKYVMIKAVRSATTKPVIAFLNALSLFFGHFHRLISDRGTAYTSKLFADYCRINGIRHSLNAVRTPRANGQVERQNQSILSALRSLVQREDRRDWDEHIHTVQWSINTMTNSTTKRSPHELLFGFEPRDILQNKILSSLQEVDALNVDPIDLNERREDAKACIEAAQQQWKRRYDLGHRSPRKYQVNDMVVVERESVATGESRKLDAKYKGPYIVAKVLGNDRYIIQDIPGVQRTQKPLKTVYASDKMKPWCLLSPDQRDGGDTHSDEEETSEERPIIEI